ncbi:hypothetical protein LKR43_06600 [Pusillimonas sp. MFBS29]|uniref:BcsR/BcsP family cellulose biosynthesis protein n=1 Tax=Pusillimonas sp. MFBS29 TaxID=2886690 RepID=UPI001D0FA913|nr:BcsR/BcsP family cellulose biosynthesis protein [Pusillimonas sp. MFBS29]MCC2596006.1 hypothetical protein [Pusillimonas sp. MFBS29]
MASSPDIAKLFKSFNNDQADRYQEIVDHDRKSASQARWPILTEIKIGQRQADPAPVRSQAIQEVEQQPKSASLPAFQFLRVQDPAIESARGHVQAAEPDQAPASPADRPSGSERGLQALFKRIGQSSQVEQPVAQPAPSSGSDSRPGQMSSLFQRLRRS